MAHRAFCGLARRRRFSVTAGPLSRHSSALGDPDAAGRALERALDIAEPDTVLSAFVPPPVPALQERHARGGTTQCGPDRRDPGPARRAPAPLPGGSPSPLQPLSDSELRVLRVLRYLPTNLEF